MNSKMNQSSNQFQPKRNVAQKNHTNFVEALKGIGSQTASSISHDVVGGVSKDFLAAFTGSPNARPNNYESSRDIEAKIRAESEHLKRHKEITETKIFDRKEIEAKAKIEAIKDQLRLLVKDLAAMDLQLEKAIEEEIVSPGTYHVTFFEKMRKFIIDLRKRVVESANWLATSYGRQQDQKSYWGNVKRSGTKYMLSQERTVATQAG